MKERGEKKKKAFLNQKQSETGVNGVKFDHVILNLLVFLISCFGQIAKTQMSIKPNSHLVELQDVEQVEEFAVLLAVLQFAVVLLQTVKGQFRLIVHKHLHRLKTNPKPSDRTLFTHYSLKQ